MTFPRHSGYKKINNSWFDEIPLHWETAQIKWLSPVKRGASPRPIDDPVYFDDDGDYGWVRISDVTSSKGVLLKTEQRLSELGSSLSVKLEPGELFLSIAGSVGKSCLSGIKCCIHDGFVYFPELSINPRFLQWIFECGKCFGGLGKLGTQLNLNTDTVGSIFIPFPTCGNEIEEIISFLDRETAKIDALIAEQEQMIELLQEKRQAVISHAVTKGLNPDVPMKDSGVEWLGEVPEHWEIKKIKYLGKVQNGSTPHKENSNYWENGSFPWMTSTAVNQDQVHEPQSWVTEKALTECTLPIIKPPAVLVGITGQGKTRGMAGTLRIEATINQHVASITPFGTSVDIDFLRASVDSMYRFLRRDSDAGGATKGAITCKDLENYSICNPPKEEQAKIVTWLGEQLDLVKQLSQKSRDSIDLLQERRSALISSAVTGQIDIRGMAKDVAA